MRKESIFRLVSVTSALFALLLGGCGGGGGGGGGAGLPPGAVQMDAITTASPTGNIQAKIGGVTVDSSTVVTFALSDEGGQPLDPNVVTTQNTSNRVRFFIAQLDATGNYSNYIGDASHLPTFDGSGSNPKGTFATVKPGVYTYTFGLDIKDTTKTLNGLAFDAAKTQTVAIQILRNTAKNGKPFQQMSDPYFSFVPAGGTPGHREVVAISACNQCHGKLIAHGSRIEIALCILCHNAGANKFSSGASIDFKVMIHKIHMGPNLPSGAYFKTSLFANFSTMTYPVFSSDSFANGVPLDCTKCHQKGTDTFGNPFGADVDKWKTNPAIATCTTCHDTTSFDGSTTGTVDGVANITLTPHAGGVQVDGSCAGCHPSTGSDFDNSVPGIHTIWEKSATNKGIVARVLSATNIGPLKYPRVTFQLTDASGNPVVIDPGTPTASFSGAGSGAMVQNNNIQIYFFVKPKNNPDFLNTKPAADPAYLSANVSGLATNNSGAQINVNNSVFANNGAVTTVDNARGIYFINFSTASKITVSAGGVATVNPAPTPLPSLNGDYLYGATVAFAAQASRADISITRSVQGVPSTTVRGTSATVSPTTVLNPVTPAQEMATAYYDIGTGEVVLDQSQLRRKVVDNAKCLACHNIIVGGPGANGVPGLHGGNRPNAEACVLCHGPNKNESDFKFLIHRWHTGRDSTAPSRWRPNYQDVTYPNDRRRCNACHIADNPALPDPATFPTRQDAPNSINSALTAFAAGFSTTGSATTMPATNRIPAITATCIACHDGTTGNVVDSSGGPTGHAIANFGTAPFGFPLPPSTPQGVAEQCAVCHTDSLRAFGHQLPN
jgi:OmcA/MtrC family decaheme c-type cytochrome